MDQRTKSPATLILGLAWLFLLTGCGIRDQPAGGVSEASAFVNEGPQLRMGIALLSQEHWTRDSLLSMIREAMVLEQALGLPAEPSEVVLIYRVWPWRDEALPQDRHPFGFHREVSGKEAAGNLTAPELLLAETWGQGLVYLRPSDSGSMLAAGKQVPDGGSWAPFFKVKYLQDLTGAYARWKVLIYPRQDYLNWYGNKLNLEALGSEGKTWRIEVSDELEGRAVQVLEGMTDALNQAVWNKRTAPMLQRLEDVDNGLDTLKLRLYLLEQKLEDERMQTGWTVDPAAGSTRYRQLSEERQEHESRFNQLLEEKMTIVLQLSSQTPLFRELDGPQKLSQ